MLVAGHVSKARCLREAVSSGAIAILVLYLWRHLHLSCPRCLRSLLCTAGPVGKELLKAAATMGLEAFQGGSEHAAAREAAEQVLSCTLNRIRIAEHRLGVADILVHGSLVAGLQAALDADGKPAWLRGLMGNDGNADLLQEQTGASSEEEVHIAVLKPVLVAGHPDSLSCGPRMLLKLPGEQSICCTLLQDDTDAHPSSLALPSIDESGLDALAAEMAKLDRAIAGPVPERPPWMQRPTAADLAAAAAAQANSTPTHRSQHSRTSSFGELQCYH